MKTKTWASYAIKSLNFCRIDPHSQHVFSFIVFFPFDLFCVSALCASQIHQKYPTVQCSAVSNVGRLYRPLSHKTCITQCTKRVVQRVIPFRKITL